jgi:hypothetical protein
MISLRSTLFEEIEIFDNSSFIVVVPFFYSFVCLENFVKKGGIGVYYVNWLITFTKTNKQ